jgi:dipeptidyl aminopeptidase/acylaminoacyl peptidase
MGYMDGVAMALEIPYEDGVSLPAYLFLPPDDRHQAGGKTPIAINVGGADSTQEELYFVFPSAGLELGYAVLAFEGPGQGMVLKDRAMPMRPDFEAMTARVLDHVYAITRQFPQFGLDTTRITIVGASMGVF